MKPTYIDLPPFEWQVFYANMDSLYETLDGLKTALREWLDNPPSKEVDPEVLTKRTTNLATVMLKHFAKLSRQENAKRRKTGAGGGEGRVGKGWSRSGEWGWIKVVVTLERHAVRELIDPTAPAPAPPPQPPAPPASS